MSQFDQIQQSVLTGKLKEIAQIVQQSLDQGLSASNILTEGLLPPMDIVGQRMKSGEMFIPEVLRSAKTVQEALTILKPLLSEEQTAGKGTAVIGTVEGDLHDIGKNLVGMLLEGAGFTVIDLGVGVPPAKFVETIQDRQPLIVGLSALLTTTMPKMAETIRAITDAGVRETVKIMAGGAPVTPEFVEEIGADGYGADAAGAVDLAKAWAD